MSSLPDANVRLIGVEAGGRGTALGEHAARFQKMGGGLPGVLQGTYCYVLQNDAGQVSATHSVSAGLDYASVGPEHAMLHDSGRAEYVSCSDDEALKATVALSRTEGIVPALESAHAVAEAMRMAPEMGKDEIIMVNLSGRGDKDMGILARELDLQGAGRRTLWTDAEGEPLVAIAFKKKPGIVAYLTAGDPDLATTREIALAAIDNGADVIELGVPFSDPLADGPGDPAGERAGGGAGHAAERCAGAGEGAACSAAGVWAGAVQLSESRWCGWG